MRFAKAALLAGAGVGAAAVAHSLPGVGTLSFVRSQFMPGLSGIGKTGHIALTFDDGPDRKSTPAFLEALDSLGWKATFFMLGVMIDRDPGLAREVFDAGHEIGLHGYEHRNHLWRGPMDVLGDMRRASQSITRATGAEPAFFRPPYGVLTTANIGSAKLIGLRTVLWTSWGRDWRSEATPQTVLDDLNSQICDGATLLLHDSDCTSEIGSWISALGALPLLADVTSSRGWSVGPLRDHFN